MDQILPPLQWIVAGGFWRTLCVCLLICPIMPQLLGIVFCSYWAPWRPSRQFYAYIPGNPFLALFIACMSTTFDGGDFYVPPWLNIAAAIGAPIFWVVLSVMDRSVYRKEQLWSVNKVYHNLLYAWYGYLAVACFGGLWCTDATVWQKLLITIPGLVWLGCLVADNSVSKERLRKRFIYAHSDNLPVWKTGARLRRLNPATGRYEVPTGPRSAPFAKPL